MSNINHLNHSSYECKYHIMFTPKYRKKELFGVIRKQLQDVFLRLARQNECEIVEGYIMKDHVYMLISIPPNCRLTKRYEFDMEPKTLVEGRRILPAESFGQGGYLRKYGWCK